MKQIWTKEKLIEFEKKIGELYLDNKLPFLFHLSGGNEDQLIKIFEVYYFLQDFTLPSFRIRIVF